MNQVPDFDAYASLIKKKDMHDDPNAYPSLSYTSNDVLELETFCNAHGIFGVNMGRNMSPKATLKMLKDQMGLVDTSTPKNILLG
jgi:hypothetical protein